MAGCFLDTTALIDLSDHYLGCLAETKKAIHEHKPVEVPFYALRELLAGRARQMCDVHNVLKSASDPGEALIGLSRRSPMEGRSKAAKIELIAEILRECYKQNPKGGRDLVKDEGLGWLKLRAQMLWKRAKAANGLEKVQPLACFNDGAISIGSSGELRGPNDSFNCRQDERCSAAGYIYDDEPALSALIDCLNPKNLDETAAQKNENSSRRKALKELKAKGPKDFDKRRCRAIGDAYFAAMCPKASVLMTTNTSDFLPLCQALGKKAKNPRP